MKNVCIGMYGFNFSYRFIQQGCKMLYSDWLTIVPYIIAVPHFVPLLSCFNGVLLC